MNRLMKQCAAFVLAFALAFTSVNMTGLSVETTYAATAQTITRFDNGRVQEERRCEGTEGISEL